jgi:hypothetical protein
VDSVYAAQLVHQVQELRIGLLSLEQADGEKPKVAKGGQSPEVLLDPILLARIIHQVNQITPWNRLTLSHCNIDDIKTIAQATICPASVVFNAPVFYCVETALPSAVEMLVMVHGLITW